MDKQNLRIKYKNIRKSIENKAFLSDVITTNILNSSIYLYARNIGVYVNLEDEVSTEKLIWDGLSNKKNISVPIVEEKDINFYTINSLEELCNTGYFGIKEPIPSKNNLIDKSYIDLLIIPGICFDLQGNRIGYGKRIL